MCRANPTRPVVLALLLALTIPAPARAAEIAAEEVKKIEALIATVEGLKGAVFIRNGQEHDCKTAAAHLRRKWKAAGDQIRSAGEFVDKLATRSSTTGERYKIRFEDGKERNSDDVLYEKLDELEGKSGEEGREER